MEIRHVLTDWDYKELAIHAINEVAEHSMRLYRNESSPIERVYLDTGGEVGAWVTVQIFVEKPRC